jgi:hypothetical protein
MTTILLVRILFVLAAVYDGALGLAFLLNGPGLFERFNVTAPNHWGYIQFPALLILVFALMFLAIAARPRANRGLIWYGVLLKMSYCGVIFRHWFGGGIPWMWKPFAIADLGFLILFVIAWFALKPGGVRPAHA